MNSLVSRPPVRPWIPFGTSTDRYVYKVILIQSDASILGKMFFVARVELLDPPRWQKQTVFDILVMDTLEARRCYQKKVKLRRINTMDSCIYVIHKIIE